jgi:hypothetical protein
MFSDFFRKICILSCQNATFLFRTQGDLYYYLKKTSIIGKIGKKYSLFRLNFIYFLAEFDLKLAIGQPKLVQND